MTINSTNNLVNLPRLVCERCGSGWTPRVANPTICPKCKSAYWNKPRRYKIRSKEIPCEKS